MEAVYKTRSQLEGEIDRLGLPMALAEEAGALAQPFRVGPREIPNRLCALPMTGDDANPDGSPSFSTQGRYLRYARCGFGIIWFEATTLDPGALSPGQLCLQDGTLAGFTQCVDALRAPAPNSLLILQLWPSHRPCVSDYVAVARLASRAGFDGVDIACCHRNRLSALLSASGTNLANRTRLLRRIVQEIRAACPELVVAVRLDAYQAQTGGFGANAKDYRRMDLAEPLILAQWLCDDGVEVMSVSASSPNLFGDPSRRASEPVMDAATPHEHPLTVLARHQDIGRRFRAAAPGLAIVGGGYSWLGRYALDAAAGAIEQGAADLVGLGRLALLDPWSRGVCSLLPFAEADLWEDGGPHGRRPARDVAYRDERMTMFDQIRDLRTEEEMLVAFQQGRIEDAYQILGRESPLPEMSSHIRSDPAQSVVDPPSTSPASRAKWPDRACRGPSAQPSPEILRQLSYMIAWTARNMGLTGLRMPATATGHRIAVIGGGPTGLAAAIRLLERGHEVSIFEREDRLGGAPALVYPADRSPDPGDEIEARLRPALEAGRLTVAVGHAASAEPLLVDHDAVLVATGCWNEPSLGAAPGVWPALQFLKAARRNECTGVPPRVVLLCGGDAAMDAAVTAKRLGAERLELTFDCPRDNAHWHLPDSWFETDGIQARFETHPTGYLTDPDGHVRGVLTAGDDTIHADMVIEAMGLLGDRVESTSERIFAAGAVVNGGASVAQCTHEGCRAAEAIHRAQLERRS